MRRLLFLGLLLATCALQSQSEQPLVALASVPSFPPLPSPRPVVHLATFAACSSAGRLPAFVAEARRSGLFDWVHAHTPASLDAAWLQRHGAYLRPSVRGCGYWTWKPQAVLQALGEVGEGEVLVWADAGSSLHRENCGRFWQYVALAASQPGRVVSFEMGRARCPQERCWSKRAAGEALNVSASSPHWDSPQLHATYFFLARTEASMGLVREWRDAAVARGYALIDDSPSGGGGEAAAFREHRHDQSLWSLLRKQRGAALRVPDDAAQGGGPIQSTRCRTGREAACTLRLFKETLWMAARESVPGLESVADMHEGAGGVET